MALLLKNVRAIDPQCDLDMLCDIAVRDGVIVEIGTNLSIPKGEIRDMEGRVLAPGFVDMHVHLRDPGQEYKEDIASGTAAAAAGGFTDICCMPNTSPVIDNAAIVEYIQSKAKKEAACRVHVSGACTLGEKGEALAEMGSMRAQGAVMFTDDGRGVQSTGMMRRVMDYAKQFDCAISSHCQDESLVGSGQINEGAMSTRLGLAGWPAAGEEIQIARDIALSHLTGCKLHIQHLSTAKGLSLVRDAKAQHIPVTCEVTPHHLFLTEDNLDESYDTNLKVNPPLRHKSDADALVSGLIEGTIDAIVTDHAPHAAHEKAREFERAPFGMIGLETSVALVLDRLVNPGTLSLGKMIEVMSIRPRAILGLRPVTLQVGSCADFTLLDPSLTWTVDSTSIQSKSTNTPFLGCELHGKPTDVYVAGYATLQDGVLTHEPLH